MFTIYQIVVGAVHSGAVVFFFFHCQSDKSVSCCLLFTSLSSSSLTNFFHTLSLCGDPEEIFFFMTLTANQECYVVTEVTQAILPEIVSALSRGHNRAGAGAEQGSSRRSQLGRYFVI